MQQPRHDTALANTKSAVLTIAELLKTVALRAPYCAAATELNALAYLAFLRSQPTCRGVAAFTLAAIAVIGACNITLDIMMQVACSELISARCGDDAGDTTRMGECSRAGSWMPKACLYKQMYVCACVSVAR